MTRETGLTFWDVVEAFKYRLYNQGVLVAAFWMTNFLVNRLVGMPIRRFSQITPRLFVGGRFKRRGWAALESWGVSAVLSMRQYCDSESVAVGLPRYLRLPTIDETAPTIEHLQEGVRFIGEELENGGKVYIHCASGVGRAPTMLAAYFVSQGLSPQQAWQKIRAVRPFVRPAAEQREQIDRFALTAARQPSLPS